MYPHFNLLDLEKVTLYGWEDKKSDLALDKLINTITEGSRVPLVPIYKMQNGIYQLTLLNDALETHKEWQTLHPEEKFFKNTGGHYRALAHYILGRPLPVMVMGEEQEHIFVDSAIKIQDITIADDDDVHFPLWKKAMHDPHYQ